MQVDISCRKCGRRHRADLGAPASGTREEWIHLLIEGLSHRPSFQCFGGHLELAPPIPDFWEIHWETLSDV